jgi:hypothetical protein
MKRQCLSLFWKHGWETNGKLQRLENYKKLAQNGLATRGDKSEAKQSIRRQ